MAWLGFVDPLTLRTYWRAAARTSSVVAGGSKLCSCRMFRHMPPSLLLRTDRDTPFAVKSIWPLSVAWRTMEDMPTTAAAPHPVTTPAQTTLILRVLTVATFVVILNETIMNNAIPRLMDDFHVTETSAQWLTTAFMLTMAVVIPMTGWIMRRLATRRTFALAMGLFTVGTTIAAAAPTFEVLVAARVVQAGGTAVMMPLLMTTLMTVVPESDRGRVMGQVTLAMSCAPALGPAVSGMILHLGSWRLIFVFVLPIAVTIIIALFYLQSIGTAKVGRLFGPIMLVYFVVLAVLGLIHIFDDISILRALSPHYGIQLLIADGFLGFIILGSVFLAVTGAEALYADMGHFGRQPISWAWLVFVFPALMLNYLGQGALLLATPSAAENPFFLMAPESFRLPLVILATMATVIASQAVITGAYSLTRNLDLTAGMRYKSERERLTRREDDRRDSQAVYVGTAFRF